MAVKKAKSGLNPLPVPKLPQDTDLVTYDSAGRAYPTAKAVGKTAVAGGKYFSEWGPRPPQKRMGGGGVAIPGDIQKPKPVTFNVPKFKAPKFKEPEMGEMPIFEAPEYDKEEVSKRAQKYAAPGVRKLRGAVQQAMTRRFDNPNLRRMSLRDALAGYGEGLENVMAGAQKSATAEYAQEYAYQYRTSGMNYQTAVQTVRDKYQGQMVSRRMDFEAEMAAVKAEYAGALEAERFRTRESNLRREDDFNSLLEGFRTISDRTTGGG